MVFSSIVFLFEYLPVVLAVYYLVPAKWRNVWLFAANMVFYGWGEPVYILLMLFSIGINYAAGLLVGKYRGCARKKARTALGVNIAAFQDKLDQSPQILLECLKARDEIGIISGKLFAYARMHRDENTADSKYQAMTSRAETLLASRRIKSVLPTWRTFRRC